MGTAFGHPWVGNATNTQLSQTSIDRFSSNQGIDAWADSFTGATSPGLVKASLTHYCLPDTGSIREGIAAMNPAPGPQTVIARCSFCSKPNTEVGTLIAGLGVFICDQCVDECVTVIADRSASASQIASWEADLALIDALAYLGPVAEATNRADRNLTSWVAKARSLGATWSQIGDALNCSRQAAWERFSTPQ